MLAGADGKDTRIASLIVRATARAAHWSSSGIWQRLRVLPLLLTVPPLIRISIICSLLVGTCCVSDLLRSPHSLLSDPCSWLNCERVTSHCFNSSLALTYCWSSFLANAWSLKSFSNICIASARSSRYSLRALIQNLYLFPEVLIVAFLLDLLRTFLLLCSLRSKVPSPWSSSENEGFHFFPHLVSHTRDHQSFR